MTSRVEELQRMCDNINENGGLDSGKWHTALLTQIAQNLAVIADVMLADRKTEQTADDLIRKSDVLETYAELYDIFDDNKAIQEELHKVFDKINDIPTIEPNSSEKPNNSTISKMEQVKQRSCDACKGRDIEGWKNPCLGCTEFTFYEPMDEPFDKDINVRSKDEPQTDIHDLTDCDFCKDRNCKDCEGGKDEPQTEREGE